MIFIGALSMTFFAIAPRTCAALTMPTGALAPREDPTVGRGDDRRLAADWRIDIGAALDALTEVDLGCGTHHVTDAGLVEHVEPGDDGLEADGAEHVVTANDEQRHRVLEAQHLEHVGERVVGVALRAERRGDALQLRHGRPCAARRAKSASSRGVTMPTTVSSSWVTIASRRSCCAISATTSLRR